MAQTQYCSRCGLALADGVAEGLCRRCLLEAGLGDTVTQHPETPADLGNPPAAVADFGPYHAIGVLGEGGMGIVYLAEQHQPVRRRVAVKVLKSADAGSQVLARFESESQALALMDHPNIAQIYDAGTTANGRPYFVMEYVQGIPITDYCDRNLLGFRERLTLFQRVCQAVHHAHQKGVIHRDLKPSNVLVMLQDAVAVPKVIDFGVAKAVNQRLTEKTLFTEMGMLIGTPEYMSPEQADLTGLDIDSTTDVYSLGVLLYELLVGALPFDSKSLRKAGYAEIQRLIREKEPPKPTMRVSTMGEAAQEVARHRRSDPRTMVRVLRGDLEWITMKAIEKDRTRRYASASEFAADITRHLSNEPVVAGPPGIGYRTRKFARRHHALVVAGSAVALALLIGAVVSFTLYLRAAQEQEVAESEGYAANLTAADMQLRAGQVSDARSRLANTLPALRGWEWRYLMSKTDESTATLYARDADDMELSEDGTQLFAYGEAFIRSYDVTTKRLINDSAGLGKPLAIDPRGKLLLTGPPRDEDADPSPMGVVLRVYDVQKRRPVSVLKGLRANVWKSAMNQQTTLVAAIPALYEKQVLFDGGRSPNGPIVVWNVQTSQMVARLEGPPAYVRALKFSPDGKLLAQAGYDKTIQLWDLSSRRLVFTLMLASIPYSITFSSDGRLLAAGDGDGKVQVWDLRTGAPQLSWQASPSGAIRAIAFSADNTQLATCSGESVRVWTAKSGELKNEFNGHAQAVKVAFHPSAPKLYSYGAGVIKEWDLGRASIVKLNEVSKVAFSPNGRYVAAGSFDHGMLNIYDGSSGRLLRTMTRHDDVVIPVAFSPDSMLVASGTGGPEHCIRIWSVTDGRLLQTLLGHSKWIWSIAFDPGGTRLVSSSEDRSIRVWDLAARKPPDVISTTSAITHVTFSPDGRSILALRRSDKDIILLDSVTKQQTGIMKTNTPEAVDPAPRSMGISHDGAVLIGPANTGQAIAIWDFPKHRLRQILPVLHGGDGMASLAISPDGSRAAIGDTIFGNTSIWDVRRGRVLVTLAGHNKLVYSLAWSLDGTRLVSAAGDSVRFWDSRSVHDYDAELLLDKLADGCLLVEEAIEELKADRKISDELRGNAIQLVTNRGNASSAALIEAAWKTGVMPNLPSSEYTKGLNRAAAAVKVIPGHGRSQITFALLQLRCGQFGPALLSAQRAMEIQKSQSADGHAIRAMAYYRLQDMAHARSEVVLARKSADQSQLKEGNKLLEEAELLVGNE